MRRFHQYLYGRANPFTLRTDHKPLLSIFGPHRGIPEVSANRLQRYAIFLSAYNYIIEYVRSADNSADYLSRACAPDSGRAAGARCGGAGDDDSEIEDRAAYIHFVVEGSLPVTLNILREEVKRDSVLQKVKQFVLNGWPKKVQDSSLKAYHNCKSQLSYEKGCLLRGHKVIIPESLRDQVCAEIHSSHFGIVKMKAEARSRLWFPGIDAALEKLAADCHVCAQLRPSPRRAPLAPWPFPPHPFYRIHLDFLGPFNEQTYLVIVDAYSKWVECYPMTSTYNSAAVISKMYDLMSRMGTPHTVVTDNGTSFTSQEFSKFCTVNGITHVLTPVYHPASNGQAESYVKILKKVLKSIILSSQNKKITQDKIAKFLFDYRNSRNGTTEKSPAELLYGRALRSRLDLLNPLDNQPSSASTDLAQTVEKHQSSQVKQYSGTVRKEIKIKDNVWIKRYINKKTVWVKGIILSKIGNVMFTVYIPELNCEVTRHLNQIRLDNQSPQSPVNRQWNPESIPDLPATATPAAPDTCSVAPAEEVGKGPEQTVSVSETAAQHLDSLTLTAEPESAIQGTSGLATPPSATSAESFSTPTDNADALVKKSDDKKIISDRPKRNVPKVDYKNLF